MGIFTGTSLRLRDLQVLPDKNCPELSTTPLTKGNLKSHNRNFFSTDGVYAAEMCILHFLSLGTYSVSMYTTTLKRY